MEDIKKQNKMIFSISKRLGSSCKMNNTKKIRSKTPKKYESYIRNIFLI